MQATLLLLAASGAGVVSWLVTDTLATRRRRRQRHARQTPPTLGQ